MDWDTVKASIVNDVKTLKSTSTSDKLKAITLTRIVEKSTKTEKWRESAVDLGILEPIVALLSCSNRKMRCTATRALRALAFDADKTKTRIVKLGAVKPLLEALELDKKNMQGEVIAIICNVSTVEANARLLGKQGVVKALAALLDSTAPTDDVTKKLVTAVWNLSFVADNRKLIHQENCMTHLLRLLACLSGNVQGIAAGALCVIAEDEKYASLINEYLCEHVAELSSSLRLMYSTMGRFKVHDDKIIIPLVNIVNRNENRPCLQWLGARAIHFLAACTDLSSISILVCQRGLISTLMDMTHNKLDLVKKQAGEVLLEIASRKDRLWLFDYWRTSSFSDDMDRIYDNDLYSDFHVSTATCKIHLHKVIIKCRCPDSEKLLSGGDSLDLTSYNAKHVQALLQWLYTGSFKHITDGYAPNQTSLEGMAQLCKSLKLANTLKKLAEHAKAETTLTKSNDEVEYELDKLGELALADELSDVAFDIDGKIMSAHKIVLYARCSYFRSMFQSGMIESRKKTIPIPEDDPETFERLLKYIYTDTVEIDSCDEQDLAMLLFMANAYDIPRLVDICEVNLKDIITVENVPVFITLADQHQAKQLFHYCVGVAASNWSVLKTSKEWKRQVAENIRENVRKMHKFLKKYAH